MKVPFPGAIDCDLHPAMPRAPDLLPYLDEYWRDQFVSRHIDKYSFVLTSYPPNSPLSARPDWRAPSGLPGGDLDMIRRQALEPFGTRLAICNPLHGAVALFNEDMAAALCAAMNDWVASELLDREPRLRASILVPPHSPELAAQRDRARGKRPALRAGAAVRNGRHAARAQAVLADLRRRREARPDDRGACRQHVSVCADGLGLARAPGRGLRGAIHRLRGAALELPGRGRVPEIPRRSR